MKKGLKIEVMFIIYLIFVFVKNLPEIGSVYRNLDHKVSRYGFLPQDTKFFFKNFIAFRP